MKAENFSNPQGESMRFLLYPLRTVLFAASTAILCGACQTLDCTSPVAVPNEVSTEPASGNLSDTASLPGGAVDQTVESALAQSIRANAQNLLNQKYPEAGVELQTLHRFQTQVVAGSNYILDVDYTDQKGAQGRLMLTVYKDLEGRYRLTQDNYPGG